MKKVSFTSMDQGTKDDYDLVAIHDSQNERGLSKRVIEWSYPMQITFHKAIDYSNNFLESTKLSKVTIIMLSL